MGPQFEPGTENTISEQFADSLAPESNDTSSATSESEDEPDPPANVNEAVPEMPEEPQVLTRVVVRQNEPNFRLPIGHNQLPVSKQIR